VVLIVEDDDPVREALAELLAARGCEVLSAADGQCALDLIAEGVRPCAVLLDWEMPRLDGAAFLAERARMDGLRDIPVYVTSATHNPAIDDRVQALAPKPLDVTALLSLLGTTCEEHCALRDSCAHFQHRQPKG